MDLKEALQKALEMEKKGYETYMQTAEHTDHPHVKKTFSYLAGEEINHIREIEEFLESEDSQVDLMGDTPEETDDFFSKTVEEFKKEAQLAEDDIEAYETAMELEKAGYKFYQKLHDESEDEKMQEFFQFLMDQENAHFELFQKDLEYLKDPTGFFGEEEQEFFEGG